MSMMKNKYFRERTLVPHNLSKKMLIIDEDKEFHLIFGIEPELCRSFYEVITTGPAESKHKYNDIANDISFHGVKASEDCGEPCFTYIKLIYSYAICVPPTRNFGAITKAQSAYTRKRGAGVKAFSIAGEKGCVTPINGLNNFISKTMTKIKSYELCTSNQSSKLLDKNSQPVDILSLFPLLVQLEHALATIVRLFDDRTAMLRRGGDDPSSNPQTAVGIALLICEINDAKNIFTAINGVLSAHLREGAKDSLEKNKLSNILNTSINKVDEQEDMINDDIINNNKASEIFLNAKKLYKTMSFDDRIIKQIISRLIYWTSSHSGLILLIQRAEQGMIAWLSNVVEHVSSTNLRKQSFIIQSKSRRSWCNSSCHCRLPIFSTHKIINGDTSNTPLIEEIKHIALDPILEYAHHASRSTQFESLISLIVNTLLEKVLDSLLRRKIKFNELGVALLHKQLEILITWVSEVKKALHIAPACPLVKEVTPWVLADHIIQTLQYACNHKPSSSSTSMTANVTTGLGIGASSSNRQRKGIMRNNSTENKQNHNSRQSRASSQSSLYVNNNNNNSYYNSIHNITTATTTTNNNNSNNNISNNNSAINLRKGGGSKAELLPRHGGTTTTYTKTDFGIMNNKERLSTEDRARWAALAVQHGSLGRDYSLGVYCLSFHCLTSLLFWENNKGSIFMALKLDLSQL